MDDTAARRLADLLETASSEDRREITAWLLTQQVTPTVPAVAVERDGRIPLRYLVPSGRLEERSRDERRDREAALERLTSSLTPGEEHQVVTLRLPQERHAQLREWCTEHGFSMAAVIRGLVERFLEERSPEERSPGV